MVLPMIMDWVFSRFDVLVVLKELLWKPLIFFSREEPACSRDRELFWVPLYLCVYYRVGCYYLAEFEPLDTWKWLLDIFLERVCHMEPCEFSFSPPTLFLSVIVLYICEMLL